MIIAVVALFYRGYLLCASFVDALRCKVDVKQEIRSPNSARTAVVFEKDCGATTSLNRQVSIVAKVGSFSPDSSPPFLVIEGEVIPAIRWLDDAAIEVGIPADAEVYRRDSRAGVVTILYR